MPHRTDFLVRVADAPEARVALDAGADRIAVGRGRGTNDAARIRDIVRVARGRARVWASPTALDGPSDDAARTLGDCGVDAIVLAADAEATERLSAAHRTHPALGGVAAFRLAADGRAPDVSLLGALAEAGFRTAMLGRGPRPSPRLIDIPGVEALARFIEAAQRRGLEAGLVGGLEAPDVPRMLALGPDVLAFRTSLCVDENPGNPLEAARVKIVRALIPIASDGATASRAPAGDTPPSRPPAPDKVFVRDFVIAAGIGAYRFEHRGAQRMRFNVEADLQAIPDTVADMRDVFSYDVIVDAIRLATRRHALLVERIAIDVAAATLRDVRVRRVRVRVEKLDILDGAVGVEIERDAP